MGNIAGDITRSSGSLVQNGQNSFSCPLPAQNPHDAARLLEGLSGAGLGAGQTMARAGVNIPMFRGEYERLAKELAEEVDKMKAANEPAEAIAKYAVNRRLEIMRKIRGLSGTNAQVIFELRDWSKYGLGGRTYHNLQRRQLSKGLSSANVNEALIDGATQPNSKVSKSAMEGGRFLKHGGRVIFVISVGMTAYTLMTAPEEELVKVIYQEAGGFVGGTLGAGAGVGICLVVGVATMGWGLLACGIVGGVGGGLAGSYAGEKIYYTLNPIEDSVNATGTCDASHLQTSPPRLP